MPWLSTCFGPPSTTTPASSGTSMAGHRLLDVGAHLLVLERVDGRGVLRPDHEVRLRGPAGGDVGGQPRGLVGVLVRDLAVVREHVGAVARHVALHGGDRRLRGRGGVVRHGQGYDGHQRDAAQRDQGPPPGPAPRGVRRREQRPEQRQEQAHTGRAGVRQRTGHRGVDDGVRQPAPRHAAGRPVGADVLHRDPGDRQPDRRGRKPSQRHRDHRQDARTTRPGPRTAPATARCPRRASTTAA